MTTCTASLSAAVAPRLWTVGDIARRLGRPLWLVRRACDRCLPDVERIGQYRVVREEDLPLVERAVRLAAGE